MKGEGTHRGNLCENSSLLQTKIKGPLLSPGRLINNNAFVINGTYGYKFTIRGHMLCTKTGVGEMETMFNITCFG